jgi:type 1 glutamine amidotransferase
MPSFGLSARLRPRRLRIAPAAVGCKPDGRRSIGGFRGPATGRSPGRRAALVADDDALVVVKLCSGRLAVDVVMFAPTSGELPLTDAQKAALLDFVHRGGGFIGIHSATDTLYDWPDYGRLVGAYFKAHSWTQVATVTVEDRAHPVTTRWRGRRPSGRVAPITTYNALGHFAATWHDPRFQVQIREAIRWAARR